jgi:hypothetical protein
MAELGRKGGSRSPLTKLRREVAADEALRQKAKAALEDALDGEDERRRFEAAKSLYSFRSAAPPAGEHHGQQAAGGGKHVGILDVLGVAAEAKMLSGAGAMTLGAERELADRLKSRPGLEQARGAVVATPPPPGKESEIPPDLGSAPGRSDRVSRRHVDTRL